jgi:very-short-patch-repair endonuclease
MRDTQCIFPHPFAGEVQSEARRRGDVRDGEERSRKFAKHLRKTMTDAETFLWSRLRCDNVAGLRSRKQHPIGPFIADFACVPALTIKVDGAHGTNEELAYDARRTAFVQRRGWHEIRVTNHDVYKNLSSVLEYIWREATLRRPPSSRRVCGETPPPRAGEERGSVPRKRDV